MSEREETRDFMSVDSFSQLPFIRPSPKPTTSSSSSSSPTNIRLFGFEFPPDTPSKQPESASPEPAPNTDNQKEAIRKFECHYCCRNFPTSQALGGHQNAHKRERQHAKRAHLQSAVAAAQAHQHYHHHHHQVREGHVYGFLNCHRGCPPPHYPTWTSTTTGLGPVSQPIINGSPLPGLWRVPGGGGPMGLVVHRDASQSMPLPPFGRGRGGIGVLESRASQMLVMSSSSSSSSPVSASGPLSGSYLKDLRGCESGAKNHSHPELLVQAQQRRKQQGLPRLCTPSCIPSVMVVTPALPSSTSYANH